MPTVSQVSPNFRENPDGPLAALARMKVPTPLTPVTAVGVLAQSEGKPVVNEVSARRAARAALIASLQAEEGAAVTALEELKKGNTLQGARAAGLKVYQQMEEIRQNAEKVPTPLEGFRPPVSTPPENKVPAVAGAAAMDKVSRVLGTSALLQGPPTPVQKASTPAPAPPAPDIKGAQAGQQKPTSAPAVQLNGPLFRSAPPASPVPPLASPSQATAAATNPQAAKSALGSVPGNLSGPRAPTATIPQDAGDAPGSAPGNPRGPRAPTATISQDAGNAPSSALGVSRFFPASPSMLFAPQSPSQVIPGLATPPVPTSPSAARQLPPLEPGAPVPPRSNDPISTPPVRQASPLKPIPPAALSPGIENGREAAGGLGARSSPTVRRQPSPLKAVSTSGAVQDPSVPPLTRMASLPQQQQQPALSPSVTQTGAAAAAATAAGAASSTGPTAGIPPSTPAYVSDLRNQLKALQASLDARAPTNPTPPPPPALSAPQSQAPMPPQPYSNPYSQPQGLPPPNAGYPPPPGYGQMPPPQPYPNPYSGAPNPFQPIPAAYPQYPPPPYGPGYPPMPAPPPMAPYQHMMGYPPPPVGTYPPQPFPQYPPPDANQAPTTKPPGDPVLDVLRKAHEREMAILNMDLERARGAAELEAMRRTLAQMQAGTSALGPSATEALPPSYANAESATRGRQPDPNTRVTPPPSKAPTPTPAMPTPPPVSPQLGPSTPTVPSKIKTPPKGSQPTTPPVGLPPEQQPQIDETGAEALQPDQLEAERAENEPLAPDQDQPDDQDLDQIREAGEEGQIPEGEGTAGQGPGDLARTTPNPAADETKVEGQDEQDGANDEVPADGQDANRRPTPTGFGGEEEDSLTVPQVGDKNVQPGEEQEVQEGEAPVDGADDRTVPPEIVEAFGPEDLAAAPQNIAETKTVEPDSYNIKVSLISCGPLARRATYRFAAVLYDGFQPLMATNDCTPRASSLRKAATGTSETEVLKFQDTVTLRGRLSGTSLLVFEMYMAKQVVAGMPSREHLVAWAYTSLMSNDKPVRGHQSLPLFRLPLVISVPRKFPYSGAMLEVEINTNLGGSEVSGIQEEEIATKAEDAEVRNSELIREDVPGVPVGAWCRVARSNIPTDPFMPGDGFVVALDGARFLPLNTTISIAHATLYGNERNALSRPLSGVAMPDSDSRCPVYDAQMSFGAGVEKFDDATATLFFEIHTVDKERHVLAVVGYAALPVFIDPRLGTQPAGRHVRDYVLNEGAFQTPLHVDQPPPSPTLRADSLEGIPRLSCASILVRIMTSEQARVQRRGKRPRYEDRVYDSMRDFPTHIERKLYAKYAQRKPLSVREASRQLVASATAQPTIQEAPEPPPPPPAAGAVPATGARGIKGALGSITGWTGKILTMDNKAATPPPMAPRAQSSLEAMLAQSVIPAQDAELMDWELRVLTYHRGRAPVPLDYNFASEYYPDLGFYVAVDCAISLPRNLPAAALLSHSPPGSFYQDVPLTKDVHVTLDYNMQAPLSCPIWMDGPQAVTETPYEPGLAVIVDVRLLIPTTGASTPAGWAALPVFERRGPFVATGTYQLPLFSGIPSRYILREMAQRGDVEGVIAEQVRAGRLKMTEDGSSVVVRLIDAARKGQISTPGWALAPQELPTPRYMDALGGAKVIAVLRKRVGGKTYGEARPKGLTDTQYVELLNDTIIHAVGLDEMEDGAKDDELEEEFPSVAPGRSMNRG